MRVKDPTATARKRRQRARERQQMAKAGLTAPRFLVGAPRAGAGLGAAPILLDPESPGMMAELGTSGIRRAGGLIQEHSAKELRGTKSVKAYAEMHDYLPVVGSAMLIYQLLVRQASFQLVPAENGKPSDSPEAVQRKDFVQEALDDMGTPFEDVVSDGLSMLTYGWCYHEEVYKVRSGDRPGQGLDGLPLPSSKYSDGAISWAKIAQRSQRTLQRWDLHDNGDVKAMVQQDPLLKRGSVPIPIEKALLFKTANAGGNPEGRSLLASSWKYWTFLKKLLETEGIGFTRDLTGIPMLYAPGELFAEKAPPAYKKALADAEKLVTGLASGNEMASVLLSSVTDAMGKRKWEFSLAGVGTGSGARNFEAISKAIARYEHRIATSTLTAFLLLGQDNVGTQALAENQTDLLLQAANAVAGAIAAPFNRFAFPRLMRANGWPEAQAPVMKPSTIKRAPTLTELGAFLTALTNIGVPPPDERQQAQLRSRADLVDPAEEL